MHCTEWERSYVLEETRFQSVREANGATFICRICVLERRLDSLEQAKDMLAKRVGKLEKELKSEQKQRKEIEEKLAKVEIKLRATIPQGDGERIDAITLNGAGSDAGTAKEAETTTPESSGGNVSGGHVRATSDMPASKYNKAKGDDKAGGEGVAAARAAVGDEEQEKRRVVFVGDSNMRKVELAVTERIGAGKRVQVTALPGKPIGEVNSESQGTHVGNNGGEAPGGDNGWGN